MALNGEDSDMFCMANIHLPTFHSHVTGQGNSKGAMKMESAVERKNNLLVSAASEFSSKS